MTKIRLGEGTIIISVSHSHSWLVQIHLHCKLHFQFKAEDKSMFRVILPHDVKAGETYKQGPAVRTKLENSPHYTLEPSFRFEVAASDADGVLQVWILTRSLTTHHSLTHNHPFPHVHSHPHTHTCIYLKNGLTKHTSFAW